MFDTATEAHYPHLLAQRAVECNVQFLRSKGFSVDKPLLLHDRSTAVQGKQSKKIVSVKTGDPNPTNSKLLPPHFRGGRSEEEDDKMEGTPLAAFSKFGIYHTPKQFLSMAQRVWHPMDSADHRETVTKYALDFIHVASRRQPPAPHRNCQ